MNIMLLTSVWLLFCILQVFCNSEFKMFNLEFGKFKEASERLDDFFFQKVSILNCNSVNFVEKLVLTFSHGQTPVERKFGGNNYVLDVY